MKMGDYAGAAPVYEKLVKAKADDAELWRNLFQLGWRLRGRRRAWRC